MRVALLGAVQSGKTEVDICAPLAVGDANYSSHSAALAETARHLTDSDEDKPTPDWSQGGKGGTDYA